MKRIAAAILAFACPLAAARELPATVREALARSGVPLSAVGAVVMPVERGAPLIAHNADEPMNPASAMKLVTAFAALDMLGPAFEQMNAELVNHSKVDPDLNPIRDAPRFQAMIASAEARLASDR